jgi:hypothetical protein
MTYVAIATDDFNRVDANPIGGNWTTITGQSALKLLSNTITPATIGNDSGARYNTGTWPDDQYCQLQVTTVGTGAQTGIGPMVRCASAAYTCYGLYISRAASNNVVLYKRVAATFTSLATRTQAFTDGDTFRIEAVGSTLRIKYMAASATSFTQLGASVTETVVRSGNPGIAYSSASD